MDALLHLWCFAKKIIVDIGCEVCLCLVCSRLYIKKTIISKCIFFISFWFFVSFCLKYSVLIFVTCGDRIDASIRRTSIYKFKEQLQKGMMFTISSFDVACTNGSYRPSRNEYKLNSQSTQKWKHLKLFWSQQTCIRSHLHVMFSMILTTTTW